MTSITDAKKAFLQLFPPFMVLLVLFPILVGFFIDYDLSDGFAIVTNLIWMLIITIPFYLTQKKLFYRIGVWGYFVIGLFEISHWLMMKGPLSIISLLIVSNTNSEEALAYLDMKLDWSFIVLLLYFIVFILALRKGPKKKVGFTGKPLYLGVVLFLVATIILGFRNRIPKYRFLPQSVKIAYAFVNELKDYRKALKDNVLKKVDAKLSWESSQKQTFVLILGESCSRNHMSLYKPELNTNPKLSARNDIITYSDVISGYSYTIQNVQAMLSDSNLKQEKKVSERFDLIDIFHSAGFKTYWISNQSPIGIWDNVISGLARKSDQVEFVNTKNNSSQEALLSRAYDENIIAPFKKVLEEPIDKKFIVLHLMGSHNTYSRRYPPNFEFFKDESSKRNRIIAEYRNSIRYNDYVVDSFLNILDKSTSLEENEISSAIYVSDHGENVFDELVGVDQGWGHDYAKVLPKVVVEVPFFVWLSKGYLKNGEEKVPIIYEQRDMPYVTDDLFHSIIDINGINTPFLDTSRSVFNKQFDFTRKRVLIDGNDYDK